MALRIGVWANGHTCTDLVNRMTIRERVTDADIEGHVLAHLPDQSDEAGHGSDLPNSFW